MAPRRVAQACGDFEQAAAAIRRDGGRLSSSRRIVLTALFAADEPVSAHDIADGLGGERTVCDISVVYRILLDLEQLGVLRQLHIADGPALYALEDGGQHEYLLCERCERVQVVHASRHDRVHAEIRGALNHRTCFTRFPLVGVCPVCAADDIDGALAS